MNPDLSLQPDGGGKRKKQSVLASLTIRLEQNEDANVETIDEALRILCRGMMRAYLEDQRGHQ